LAVGRGLILPEGGIMVNNAAGRTNPTAGRRMMKLRIVADDKIPFLRGALEPFAEVTYLPGGAIAPADVKNADFH